MTLYFDFILYIDLIFINHPNLVISSRGHLSLHKNYHHQNALSKPNLKLEYTSLNKSSILDFCKC